MRITFKVVKLTKSQTKKEVYTLIFGDSEELNMQLAKEAIIVDLLYNKLGVLNDYFAVQ